MRKSLSLAALVFFVIGLSLLLTPLAGAFYIPGEQVRRLAQDYLNTTFNPENPVFTAYSPEAVTAIVWDYRGLDTVFETTVFFLAIVAALALARGIGKYVKPGGELGLSIIVKTVTRITAPMIVAVAASIALHGHLTPGGGFQGGAAAAVAPLVILVVFSHYYLLERGVSKDLMLVIRTLGLLGIGLTAIAAYLIGASVGAQAYVFQNQAKAGAPVSLPAEVGGQLFSGSLWFFNFSEFFAVMAGFTIVFLLLAVPERAARSGGG